MRSYYIVSSARSGSTSLGKILDCATNGVCTIEPSPSLHAEARTRYDGRPVEKLESKIIERLIHRRDQYNNQCEVYGEKQIVFGGMIEEIYNLTGAKFIYLTRDGRDSVKSLINWNDRRFGNIYRECAELGNLSVTAIHEAAIMFASADLSDYARPRPTPDEKNIYDKWMSFSRFEMCAYYWQRVNRTHREEFKNIPQEDYIKLNITNAGPEKIVECANFVGLKGLDLQVVEQMLGQKINSVEDRGETDANFPSWKGWTDYQKQRFNEICGEEMVAQGYFSEPNPSY